MPSIGELTAKIDFITSSFNAKIKKVQKDLNHTKRGFQDLGKQSKVSGNQISKSIRNVALQFIGLNEALQQVRAVVETQKVFDQINTRLKILTGSATQSQIVLDRLAKTSNQLGLNFANTANDFSKFATSAKFVGFSIQESEKVFNAVSKAVGAMSLNAQDATGVFRALEQMLSKGTVSSEELKLQLGDRLPGAFSAAADAMNTTTAGLTKMLAKGEIVSKDFLPKFADVLEKRFANAADEASTKLQAIQNRIANTTNEIRKSIAESVGLTNLFSNLEKAFSSSKGIMLGTIDVISQFISKIGSFLAMFPQFGITIGTAIGDAIISPIKRAIEWIEKNRISDRIKAVFVIPINGIKALWIKLIDLLSQGFNLLITKFQEKLVDFLFSLRSLPKFGDDFKQMALKINASMNASLDNMKKKTKESTQELALLKNETQDLVNLLGTDLQSVSDKPIFNFDKTKEEMNILDTLFIDTFSIKAPEAINQTADAIGNLNQSFQEQGESKGFAPMFQGMTEIFKNFGKLTHDTFESLQNKVQSTSSQIGTYFKQEFADKATDSLMNLGKKGKSAFKDFARSIINDITRIITKQQILNLLMGAFGVPTGTPGSNTGVPSSNTGVPSFNIGVPTFNAGGVGFNAKGGIIDKPTFLGTTGGVGQIGGEAGKEAVLPLGRTSDGDLGVKAQPSMVNINIINNTGANIEQRQLTPNDVDIIIGNKISRGTGQVSKALRESSARGFR